ncbi:MAG TPA: CvpA family protein [Myxococcales bacterium]|nr:CvpA family protein [Myxococcales bacterium]
MNGFDLFCLLLVLLFGAWGAFRGLLRQIFGLIGFVGGIVLVRLFSGSFGEAFGKDLGMPEAVATAVMAIALFLAAEIAAKLVGNFLHKRMTGGFTRAVERGGGFLLGSAKGLLVAWAFASLLALLRPHLQHLEKDTALAKLDLGGSHVMSVAREVNLITELRAKKS